MPPSEVAPAGVAGGDLRTSRGPRYGAPVAAWRLPSGLLLLVETDHRLPLVALHLDYPAGSRHEPAARCGLAHLTEHLAAPAAQRGTREGGPTIPELGGWANAATAHDRTSFTQMLPSGQLAAGLRIEADRVGWTFSRLTDEALALEKRVLLQERRERVENRPYGRSLEILQALLFPDGHPYGRPAAGLPEGVEAVGRGDVEMFLGTRYRLDGTVLAVVGDVTPSEVERAVTPLFGGGAARRLPVRWDDAEVSPAITGAPPERAASPLRRVVEDEVAATRVFLALRTAGFGRCDWYAASLLVRSLALGRSSRLKQRLVHATGLASEVEALAVTFREAGLLALAVTAAPGVERRRLEEALCESVLQGLTEPVAEWDLARARKKALTDHSAHRQYLDVRADRLAAFGGFLGDPGGSSREETRWLAPGPDELLAVGRELCRPGNLALLAVVPPGGR